ncbi:lipoprotein-releasing system ATP-binding protein LolD [Fulvitalea axinellae]|uniref:Lipoprotein-releasing system ATP-binding protein LolD n=1 Tax=Fulvitalea axinellae TaxID=1182444 RepID=A0AAU9DBG4_9BACT|nr:lipoprotein-releasing system ATP-binding protein LolD [Fulvitalea axinellae]
MASEEFILRTEDVKKTYGELAVLKGVTLDVRKGELLSIVGASGAGKSTLLHIMGTLDRPDSGRVTMNGTDISGLDDRALARFRNTNMGFVFQFHNLLPEFTALENICMPGFIAGRPEKDVKRKAEELMELLKISERKDHKPSELSGGEQQRVSIARALVNDPEIVFGDEPSGNLDSKNAEELHGLFFKLKEELNCTFVLVTHNMALSAMADRTLEMRDGILI